MEIYGYSIKHIENENEKLVAREMNQILDSFPDFCGCQLCVEDVFMLSLNLLPPRYKHQLTLRFRTKQISREELAKAITQAVDTVIKNPKHAVD